MNYSNKGVGKKAMVRFRHGAVKNGEVSKDQSWVSGFLFITPERVMLASGADQYSILFSDLLSIEDTDFFSLPDSMKDSVTALMFGSGIDVYVTLIATTPYMKKEISSLVYHNIMKSINDIEIRKKGGEYSLAKVRIDGNKLRFLLGSGEVYAIDRMSDHDIKIREMEEGYEIEVSKSGSGYKTIEIKTTTYSGDWIRSFIGYSKVDAKPSLGKGYLEILEVLSNESLDSYGISSRVGKLTNEISKMINEMIFMDWVRIDYGNRGYTLTDKGISVLYSSTG